MKQIEVIENNAQFDIVSGVTPLVTSIVSRDLADSMAKKIVDRNNDCKNRHDIFTV